MRIAIILSAAWRAGMLRNAKALAKTLIDIGTSDTKVVLGLRKDGPYNWSSLEAEFANSSQISFRRFRWETRSAKDVIKIHSIKQPTSSNVMFPRDDLYDFLDCDAWIVFANSLEGCVVPCRPIATFCADLIQKYVPEIFGGVEAVQMWEKQEETFRSWRASKVVFVTTPPTARDLVSYAGVPEKSVILLQPLIDPVLDTNSISPVPLQRLVAQEKYILWVTNASPHKNAVGAVAALKAYYQAGGTLKVIICGQDTEKLDPASDFRGQAAEIFDREPEVLKQIQFAGEVSDVEYIRLVNEASFVWHNVIVDNGTFVLFDAARADRIFVSSDYPQMRYLCETYGAAARFHPHDSPKESAAALLAAELDSEAGVLPGHRLRPGSQDERLAGYKELLVRLME